MSRKVRKVPADWEHPKNTDDKYIPLFGDSFTETAAEWDEAKRQWDAGYQEVWFPKEGESKWKLRDSDNAKMSYEEWSGERPEAADYMPDWPEAERTHLQMYETTTEGTPVSPVMQAPEELARWLADNNASAFGGQTASYEDWLRMIQGSGSASSAATVNGVLVSGVTAGI